MSEQSLTCLALVKPYSRLMSRLSGGRNTRPTYGIYEYSAGFGTRELRFGDGSGIQLSACDKRDLILLEQFGEQAISALFDGGEPT